MRGDLAFYSGRLINRFSNAKKAGISKVNYNYLKVQQLAVKLNSSAIMIVL